MLKKIERNVMIMVLLCAGVVWSCGEKSKEVVAEKHRVLISTDIGGTDPDDFQSMIHLLMYADLFEIEGLVSSPSFGDGSKQSIYDMIELYEKDLPKLQQKRNGFPSPDALRALCKQGRSGLAGLQGYASATEGSDWIIECAKKKSDQPLWVLVWGGLEDLAQALHDAPEIQDKIKVYWIGGPNKKWSVNSYAYIAENFPNLWFIENNASYRGFISDNKREGKFDNGYYEACIRGAGHMGEDYINYYDGNVKMGDTPSLLYLMNGDVNDPEGESWGGSFEKLGYSPKVVFDRVATLQDTVPVYAVLEFRIKGPEVAISPDSACFTLTVDKQNWSGYYLGEGNYMVRYAPKAKAVLEYKIESDIPGFPNQEGAFVVANVWPGAQRDGNYRLGNSWYTDKGDVKLFEKGWQGSQTVSKWREEVLKDWEERLTWLKSVD